MPPLSPTQVNMITVPLSFLSKIFKHFVGIKMHLPNEKYGAGNQSFYHIYNAGNSNHIYFFNSILNAKSVRSGQQKLP